MNNLGLFNVLVVSHCLRSIGALKGVRATLEGTWKRRFFGDFGRFWLIFSEIFNIFGFLANRGYFGKYGASSLTLQWRHLQLFLRNVYGRIKLYEIAPRGNFGNRLQIQKSQSKFFARDFANFFPPLLFSLQNHNFYRNFKTQKLFMFL